MTRVDALRALREIVERAEGGMNDAAYRAPSSRVRAAMALSSGIAARFANGLRRPFTAEACPCRKPRQALPSMRRDATHQPIAGPSGQGRFGAVWP